MKYFIIVTLIILNSISCFSQVKTIDINIFDIDFKKFVTKKKLKAIYGYHSNSPQNIDSENTYVATSETDDNIYYFFSKRRANNSL